MSRCLLQDDHYTTVDGRKNILTGWNASKNMLQQNIVFEKRI